MTTAAPPARDRSAPVQDRLGAEVRESVLLLLLSVLVTAGVAGVASAVLSLLS
jgi:hypothetical protein